MHIVVAITGASGAPIAVRLLGALAEEHEVSLVLSEQGRRVLALEVPGASLPAARHYEARELSAPIASSSRAPDAMVICPCSMRTAAAVAHGLSDNLVTRCAENMLRLRRPLVLVPRETPLSAAALHNLARLASWGAFIVMPVLTYYFQPRSLDDMADFVVGKVLDCLGLPHRLYRRWAEEESGDNTAVPGSR